MKSPHISVIVPVYKVEQYLQECIDSILNQTFSGFELILVDDGSPDGCGEICDRNAEKDSRIVVIHQDNRGATRARANGVAAARGEFITFVDGDDTLPANSLEILINPVNDGIDIVIGHHQNNTCPPKGLLSAEMYLEKCITLRSLSGGPWARLYRRTLFDESVFDIPADVKNGEDCIMNIRIGYKLRKNAYSTGALVYYYRDVENSATKIYRSPEAIALYQKYRLASIAEQDVQRCLPLGLADSLILYWCEATGNRMRIPASVREEHDYLVSILKYSDINFGRLSRMFFCSRNTLVRFTIRCVQNLLEIIRRIRGKAD